MDIRKHRFIAPISTTSKIFVDKKRKSNTRSRLKQQLRHECE
jgi:hypothetical protein